MFFLLLFPVSVLAWLLGGWHTQGKPWAKYIFLVLLLAPVFLEVQALVIFITGFFIAGAVYQREESFSVFFDVFRGTAKPRHTKKRPSPPRGERSKQHENRKDGSQQSTRGEPENETQRENASYREEVRRRRQEEIKRERNK